jgi:hypothetical protein
MQGGVLNGLGRCRAITLGFHVSKAACGSAFHTLLSYLLSTASPVFSFILLARGIAVDALEQLTQGVPS